MILKSSNIVNKILPGLVSHILYKNLIYIPFSIHILSLLAYTCITTYLFILTVHYIYFANQVSKSNKLAFR